MLIEKMHACVQMCDDLHCDLGDGGDDAGNDADAGSGGGATMMIAMMTVATALVKLMIVVW